jgi:DNA repair exonuclease SbcCD ATPase subunit
MRILSFTAENFKKIRVVEIVPKGRTTTITGRNGQGKTSVLDALWALFAGKKAIPEKPVRKGAEKSKLSAVLSDEQDRPYLIAKRVISSDRTTSLTIEAAPGAERPAGTPQAVLDALIGEMSFDPVEFIRLGGNAAGKKRQVEILRGLVKLDVNLDELTNENRLDYGERTNVSRKIAELRAQAAAVIFSPGLPRERVDEAEIRERRRQANEANAQVVQRIQEKTRLARVLEDAEEGAERHQQLIRDTSAQVEQWKTAHPLLMEDLQQAQKLGSVLPALIETARAITAERLRSALERAKEEAAEYCRVKSEQGANLVATISERSKVLEAAHHLEREVQAAVAAARVAWEQAPASELVNLSDLDDELSRAELTNREIGKRERRDEIEAEVLKQEAEAARLTRAMEAREEKKRAALAGAKMPVEGLTFDEEKVWFKGIPLEQLGEAEQIRVGCALAMAANPKLRCVPIAHGESLDEESLALIDKLAEEHDFQIFMARVDASGKVGIVLEDGMVQAVNE